MFTAEQLEYIKTHLRDTNKELAIVQIAKDICIEFRKPENENENPPTLEDIVKTAILMNLGETHPTIAPIYDTSRCWGDEEISLNKLHGEYSVQMAKSNGINLTPEQEAVIIGHSKGIYPSTLGQIIKAAEVCKATKSERWYEGKKKPPAKDFSEVEALLKENGIDTSIISAVRDSYGKQQFVSQQENDDRAY